MSISTRQGDAGETSLIFNRPVAKDHIRVRAYGAVDELAAVLGMARAAATEARMKEQILLIQKELSLVMSELAVLDEDREKFEKKYPRLNEEHLARLDRGIEQMESASKPVKDWVIPGNAPVSAGLHWARTVCRRAEREVVALWRDKEACWLPLSPVILKYMNRLSDFLWLLAVLDECRTDEAIRT